MKLSAILSVCVLATLALSSNSFAGKPDPGKYSIKGEGVFFGTLAGAPGNIRSPGGPCNIDVKSVNKTLFGFKMKSFEARISVAEADVLSFQCTSGVDIGYNCSAKGKNYSVSVSPESWVDYDGKGGYKYHYPEYNVYKVKKVGKKIERELFVSCVNINSR